jgi:hypothetical protein
MRIEWNNIASSPISSVSTPTARPQFDPDSGDEPLLPSAAVAEQSGLPSNDLTQAALRAAVMQLGVSVDAESMELAETFARLGLPLTEANLVEGRALLARFPKLPSSAYAMAKLLEAPLTPGVLRALARVVDDSLAKNPLPAEVLSDLSLALDGAANPSALAKELFQIIARLGRSTEQRVSESNDDAGMLLRVARFDPRAQLLAVASEDMNRDVRQAADAHAAHIEGQQLLNQIALKRFDPPVPLYFAFPVKVSPDATAPAEVQVWTKDEEGHGQGSGEFAKPRMVLSTTVRLTTPRLGSIEVRLTGKQDASLECQVLVEKPNAYRLLRRFSTELAEGLCGAGWNIHDVTVGMASDFTPLWYGGAALAQPRGRVDQKA